jgi:calumenin
MKRNCQLFVFALTFLSIVASAVPKPEEKRVLDHDFAQHMGSHDEHNKQFDHEQFLGEDQAKTFDQLAPEESRRRLG